MTEAEEYLRTLWILLLKSRKPDDRPINRLHVLDCKLRKGEYHGKPREIAKEIVEELGEALTQIRPDNGPANYTGLAALIPEKNRRLVEWEAHIDIEFADLEPCGYPKLEGK